MPTQESPHRVAICICSSGSVGLLVRHLLGRAHLARDNGDTTPYGDSPLATSSFRVFHARRMSNAIVVADSRAVERYLGLHPTRQVGAPDALHPIDERAGY